MRKYFHKYQNQLVLIHENITICANISTNIKIYQLVLIHENITICTNISTNIKIYKLVLIRENITIYANISTAKKIYDQTTNYFCMSPKNTIKIIIISLAKLVFNDVCVWKNKSLLYYKEVKPETDILISCHMTRPAVVIK